jgi:hypothetical protein
VDVGPVAASDQMLRVSVSCSIIPCRAQKRRKDIVVDESGLTFAGSALS